MKRIFLFVFVYMFIAALGFYSHAFRTDTITINSANLPRPMKVTVIRPDAAVAGEKCPVAYLLNGFSGDYRNWTGIRPDLGRYADLYGMIMVMPDGMDSWYWDSPRKPEMKMETFFIKELVPHIDSSFPTIADPKSRAITGLSMGGQGAMYLAGRHPDVFGVVGSTSGGVDIRPFPNRWRMKEWLGEQEANKKVWDEYTVMSLVPAFKQNGQKMIFDCGTDDFFFEVNNNFHKALLDSGVKHDYIVRPGTHNGAYWANSILYQLLFFNEAFKK